MASPSMMSSTSPLLQQPRQSSLSNPGAYSAQQQQPSRASLTTNAVPSVARNRPSLPSNQNLPDKNDIDYHFKVILIGDSGVGKSSICNRFCLHTFAKEHKPTIGLEFASVTRTINGDKCMMQIWDTAGEERFKSLTRTYFRGAHGVILVYDVCKYSTYLNATEQWLPAVMEHDSGFADGSIVMLVGNKSDLPDQQVKLEEVIMFTKMRKVHLAFHTSASGGQYVEEAFSCLFEALHARASRSKLQPNRSTASQPQVRPGATSAVRAGGRMSNNNIPSASSQSMRPITLEEAGREKSSSCSC